MSRLQEIIEDQLAEARAKGGQKIVRKLGRGLRIEMVCSNANVYLTLTRDDKFPSLQEWETVTRSFPYEVPRIDPIPGQNGSRFTITARFASKRAEQMKFL